MLWIALLSPLMVYATALSSEYGPHFGYSSNVLTQAGEESVPSEYSGYRTDPRGFREPTSLNVVYQKGVRSIPKYVDKGRNRYIVRDAGALTSRNQDEWRGHSHLSEEPAGQNNHSDNRLEAKYDQKDHSVAANWAKCAEHDFSGLGAVGNEKRHQIDSFHNSGDNRINGKNTKFDGEDRGAAYSRDPIYVDDACTNCNLNGRRANQNSARGKSGVPSGDDAPRTHDLNSYLHNQDLAIKRIQDLAEDSRLAQMGLYGMRGGSEKVRYPELW